MNIVRFLGKNPLLYLIAFIFWYGLELLIWKIFGIEKILDKLPGRKKVEKALHVVLGVLAVILAAFFIGFLRHMIGVDRSAS